MQNIHRDGKLPNYQRRTKYQRKQHVRCVRVLAAAAPPSNSKYQPTFVEKSHPEYKLTTLLEMSQTTSVLPIENYIGQIQVKYINQVRGRGIFANKRFEPGEIIMIEKAMFSVVEGVDFVKLDTQEEICRLLAVELVTKSKEDQSLKERLLTLWAGTEYETVNFEDFNGSLDQLRIVKEDGELPEVEYERVLNVVQFNSFSIQPRNSRGLFFNISMLNHSCLGNVTVIPLADILIIRATKVIEEGEEITWNYKASVSMPVLNERLKISHGFDCLASCSRPCGRFNSKYGVDLQSRKDMDLFYRAGNIGLKDLIRGALRTGTFLNHILRNALVRRMEATKGKNKQATLKRLKLAYTIAVNSNHNSCCEYAWRLHRFYKIEYKNDNMARRWEGIARRMTDIYYSTDIKAEIANKGEDGEK